MKIRLLVPRGGPNAMHNVNDEIDVSDAEAKRMMEASPPQAVPAVSKPKVETRHVEQSEGGNKAKRVTRNAGRG